MTDPVPVQADPAEVRTLLALIGGEAPLAARLDALSQQFLGRPYLAFTLFGSLSEPEQMVSRLDGFDCVTFAESVVALATADRPADFVDRLRALRYEHGELAWGARNHFMNRWIARNQAAGRVGPVLADAEIETGEVRHLSALGEGYPVQTWPVRYVPSEVVVSRGRDLQPGDVVAFVSNRTDLDTFHVGLLFPGDPVRVRHAGRSAGQVVEEPLADFVHRNDVPGMLLARPLSRDPRGSDGAPGGR